MPSKFDLFDQAMSQTQTSPPVDIPQEGDKPVSKFDLFDQAMETSPTDQSPQPEQTEGGKEYTTFQRLAQFGRGITNTYTGLNDLLNQYLIHYGVKGIEKGLEVAGFEGASKAVKPYTEAAGESQTLKKSQEWWNEKAGRDLTPTDDMGKFLTYAGEFSAPIPIKGGKQVLDAVKSGTAKGAAGKIADMTGRNLSRAAGASAGMTMLEGALPEKYEWPNTIVQLMEAVGGAALAEKAYGGAKGKILQALGKTALLTEEQLAKEVAKQTKKEAFQEIDHPNVLQRGVGKILSKTVKKDEGWEDLIKSAKEEGIDLPFNVALGGGKFKNLLANNIFKSMFTSKVYNDVITNADKAMVRGLKEVIESAHPSQTLRGEVSDAARGFLREESKTVMAEKDKLFDYAETLAKPEDKITLHHLVTTMKDMKKKMADAPSADQKFVLKRIVDIADQWNLLPKAEVQKIRAAGDEVGLTPHILEQIEKHLPQKSTVDVPLERAISQRKAWDADIGYEREIPGVKNWMNGLIGSLEKDIGTTTNKKYLEALSTAKSYFKQNVVDRIRTDMAESLMKGEVPKEAFQYMDAPQRVKHLSHILGESPQAKDVMQSLKRSKLNEILYERAVDGGSTILTETGHIKYGALANNLIKSSNVELVKELLDPEAFQQLQRLARISRGMHSAGREVGTNTSVTGIASSDIGQFKKILDATLGSLDALVGGGAGAFGLHAAFTGNPVIGTASALAYPAAIRGFSYILGDKKIIDSAILYAQAATKNDQVKMRSILKELSRKAAGIVMTEEGQIGFYNYKARELNERTEKRKKEKALP